MEISKMDRQKIRDCYADGITQQELSEWMGVSLSTVKRVIAGTYVDTLDERADMMEAMIGGATVDAGCYNASVPKNTMMPDALVDNNDPLSIMLAEEEVKSRDP